jgi:hypothetical protein
LGLFGKLAIKCLEDVKVKREGKIKPLEYEIEPSRSASPQITDIVGRISHVRVVPSNEPASQERAARGGGGADRVTG